MHATSDDDQTHLISRWQTGDALAGASLAREAYEQLHRSAVRQLAGESRTQMQPTELVNEAWLRLSARRSGFESREHFHAIAALQMRNLLIDLARRRESEKRRGQHVTLTVSLVDPGLPVADLSEVAAAMDQLEHIDVRKAQVFALTEMAGFTASETARLLGVSTPTVERDLRFARAWLTKHLS